MSTTPFKVTERRITDYTTDPRNANKGTPRGLGVIEDSLNYAGAGRSLVADADGVLIAGNKTQEAAVNAGIEQVIEIETDGDALIVHKRRDLRLTTDARAKALAVADNRASELSLDWDADVLASLLSEINSSDEVLLRAAGFHENELAEILNVDLPVNNAAEHWVGMPDFEQNNAPYYLSIKVHFADENAMKAFAAAVGETVTLDTKYLIFPNTRKNPNKAVVK
jgi:hypothetical protein